MSPAVVISRTQSGWLLPATTVLAIRRPSAVAVVVDGPSGPSWAIVTSVIAGVPKPSLPALSFSSTLPLTDTGSKSVVLSILPSASSTIVPSGSVSGLSFSAFGTSSSAIVSTAVSVSPSASVMV